MKSQKRLEKKAYHVHNQTTVLKAEIDHQMELARTGDAEAVRKLPGLVDRAEMLAVKRDKLIAALKSMAGQPG
jgi:hypothetical protein